MPVGNRDQPTDRQKYCFSDENERLKSGGRLRDLHQSNLTAAERQNARTALSHAFAKFQQIRTKRPSFHNFGQPEKRPGYK